LRKKIIYGSVEAVCSLKLVKRVFKMGLINFIKGQFIEVIEWTDSSADTIVYRFPVANKEIKMGAS